MPIATELTINTAATALDMANAIFGPGITVTGASYTGSTVSSGIYSGATATIPGISPSDTGVILSTGNVADFTNSSGTTNTNTVANRSTNTTGSVDGDAQLNAVAGMATFDGAILQASFIPDGDYLTMQFVFSSEEYPEYINSNVNDSFGVWVNGTFVPVSITIAGNVAIDEINAAKNRNFYHDNTADQFNTEMDGFTYTLSLKAPVNIGQVNTIKIGIADGGDAIFDSNLLIMGDSIQTVTLAFDDDANVVANGSRTFDILANDSNPNGTLLITQIQGQTIVAGQTITLASGQQVRLNADGTITVFATSALGTENFSYTVSDNGVTDVGYVSINTAAGAVLDGIVSGTTDNDFIDAFYTGDVDGDRVDNNDATGVQGTTGNGDVIQAGAGNDYVLAGAGNDIIEAGTGNDTVDGGAGNDRTELGAGNDTYLTSNPVAAGNDTVLAEAGNDAVLTGDGNDLIYGGAGNDSLQGGAGNDALYGGDDADRFLANAGDVVVGGEGGNDNDTLAASGVATLIYGGGNNEAGTLTFADGRTLTFSQIEKLQLNGGNPEGLIYGTAGNDVIGAGYVDANGDVIDNNDSILTNPQGTNGDEVYAGDGDDTVLALLGDDFVYGGAGQDSLDGGVGNDYMQGDAGNDTLFGGDGNDFMRGDAGNDFVYGGVGDDTTYGGAGNDQVFGGAGNDQMFGGFGVDTVYGGVGNDTITGSGENDIVYGEDGDDSLQGGDGNDTMFGGAGNDTMRGEEDADTFYAGAGDTVDGSETFTTGTDNDSLYVTGPATVVFDKFFSENGTITFTAGGSVPFFNIENVFVDGVQVFPPNFVVDGTAGDNLIDAAFVDAQGDRIDANDNLVGTNDDVVLAGLGNDTVLSGVGNDQVYAGAGNDAVTAAEGDDLVYGGTGNDAVTGGVGNDTLYGDDGDDNLNGGDIAGSDGNDLLYGGAGNDTLSGGGQADSLYGGTGDDLITGGPDNAPDGRDLLDGGDGNDTLLGGFDADTLIGAAGNDSLSGQLGNDRFVLGNGFGFDTIQGGEDAGNGDIDVLDASANTEGAAISFGSNEAGTYTNTGNTAGAAFSEIERLILGSGRDFVDGATTTGGINVDLGAGNDLAYGGLGADSIFAGLGQDIVQGGKGNDLIDLGGPDGARDVLNMLNGDGRDTITGFEAPLDNGDGTFTGKDLLQVSGMTDASGNPVNVLDVVVSNDDSGNAVLTFPNGESVTLAGVSPASVASQAALIAMGIPPAGDGIVSGTAGGDLIDASYAGDNDGDRIDANDALLPGAVGNDDLVRAGAGNDTVLAGGGSDDVFGDAGNDQLFGGAGNDTLSGGIGNDSLTGDAGNDLTYGGDGDDLIHAGTGSDTTYGGGGADTFLLQSPGAVATIFGGEAGLDFDTLDLATLTGGVLITYTGAEAGTIAGMAPVPSTFAEIENLVLTQGNDTVDARADTAGIYVSDFGGSDTILGGSGNDTVFSGSGADTVAAGLGNDNLSAGSGNDSVDGGAGNDFVQGQQGDDQLFGGLGADTLDGGSGADTLSGGAGNDVINLGAFDGATDFVALADGDDQDIVTAFAGPVDNGDGTFTGFDQLDVSDLTDATGQPVNTADVIVSDDGAGNAVLTFPNGEAVTLIGIAPAALASPAALAAIGIPPAPDLVVDGTAGSDLMTPGYTDMHGDIIDGADGITDTIFGYGGNDSLQAGFGHDLVFGGSGDDQLDGDTGNDTLTGDVGDDALFGGDGNDQMSGGAGNDSLFGWQDDDTLAGGTGNDMVDGDEGNDQVFGGAGVDTLIGDAGDDTLNAGDDNDKIYGGDGNDSVLGGDGDDLIFAGGGNDTLTGDAGNDSLSGGDDRDTFFGGAGDVIDGGEGGDDYDVLDLRAYTHAGTNILYTAGNAESGTVQFLDGAGAVTDTLIFSNIEKIIACFTLGAMIQTERGEVAVEELHAGDKVLTRDHGLQPIRWVGRRDLSQTDLAREPRFSPIRIEKGALGANLPQRDLMVSPQHRMLVSGPRAQLLFGDAEVLVAATHMVGMTGVQRVYPRGISYVHILFDQHQIVRADGAWSESFQPGAQTLSGLEDAQRDEVLALFPHLNEGEAYPAARLKLKASEARVLLQI